MIPILIAAGALPIAVPVDPAYAAWSVRYPALASSVSQPLYEQYVIEAGFHFDVGPCSVVTDPAQRAVLTNMVVAHIAALNGATPASAAGIVGRISRATEGSVSVEATLDGAGIPAYWSQTPYGIAFWQAMAPYRTMHYVPGPEPLVDPFAFPYSGQWGGLWQ